MGSSLEPLETFFYTHPLESSAELVLIKVMGPYSGSALNRDGPLNYKEKKATSMSSGSCSLGTCVFTRRPTWASSPTAVISARRSSTMTPRCRLTRGPTPKRSLSAVSTVKKLSTTVGTSVVTLWARALHVPRVSPVFCSLRSVKSHQETHSKPLAQDPALGPSPFCFKKEIHNDLSLLQHKGWMTWEELRRILGPGGSIYMNEEDI